MDRGEKKEGVRQGRPTRRGMADIVKEADRIVRERIHEVEKQKEKPLPPLLTFLFGMAVGALLCIAVPFVVHLI